MTWDMVDLKKRTATLLETKNGEKRIVPISSEALHAISVAWRRAVARTRVAYEKECKEKGAKPDPSFLVGLTFHGLRHEATSWFFEKGLNPMQVAAITGHKTLQMLKRYTYLKAEDLTEKLK